MKHSYTRPAVAIVRMGDFCDDQTIPVHFSDSGNGQVDGKETDFDEDENSNGGYDWNRWDDDFTKQGSRNALGD